MIRTKKQNKKSIRLQASHKQIDQSNSKETMENKA